MIRFDKINGIHLYSGPTSMRFGIYKIQQLIALEYALENVGKKPIGGILPYSKDLEIR